MIKLHLATSALPMEVRSLGLSTRALMEGLMLIMKEQDVTIKELHRRMLVLYSGKKDPDQNNKTFWVPSYATLKDMLHVRNKYDHWSIGMDLFCMMMTAVGYSVSALRIESGMVESKVYVEQFGYMDRRLAEALSADGGISDKLVFGAKGTHASLRNVRRKPFGGELKKRMDKKMDEELKRSIDEHKGFDDE